jgi:hypothetical protein
MGWYRHEKGPPGISPSGPSRAQNSLGLKHRTAPVFLSLAAARGCCEVQKAVPAEEPEKLKLLQSCIATEAVSVSTPMAFFLVDVRTMRGEAALSYASSRNSGFFAAGSGCRSKDRSLARLASIAWR